MNFLVFLLLAGQSMADQPASIPAASAPTAVLLRDVQVIDTAGKRKPEKRSVLIEGERIARIARRIQPPPGARVVDAKGKYLIPGLCDMHVHGTAIPGFAELYTVNGVTCVRDMFGPMPQIQWLRSRIVEGKAAGPRILAAGRIVDGPKPFWPGSFSVSTPEEGRQAVAAAQKEGADFIKVYSGLPRDAYFAIAEEAKARGMVFAGHPPRSVSAAEASDAGQKSIEHLEQVLATCSTREAEFLEKGIPTPADLLGSQDPSKCAALIAKFAKNQTWHCPTLTVIRNLGRLNDPAIRSDPRLAYIPRLARDVWAPEGGLPYMKDWNEERSLQLRLTLGRMMEVVGQMQKAGVPLLAGTDVMNPFVMPGFSLHDELQLLVESGLTPLEALQAATRNPALFRGDSAEYGTVEEGKVADLVLLDANPLRDIRNTTRIQAMFLRGRLYDRAQLDAMLERLRDKEFGAAKP
jgi:imidazolonepropionase-like amidohydrolase